MPGEYDKLLEAQGGRCAICGSMRKYRLNVDHDHKTGEVRGLLCRLCNGRLLTAARDSVDILEAAIDYLTHPPAKRHLSGPRVGNAPRKNNHGRQPKGGYRKR